MYLHRIRSRFLFRRYSRSAFLKYIQSEVFTGAVIHNLVLDTDTIVLDHDHVVPVRSGTHQYTYCIGFAMFADIGQCLLDNAQHLDFDFCREFGLHPIPVAGRR